MKRILIAEDLADNQELIKTVLGDKYETAFAVDGEEALLLAESFEPDLIITDLQMPKMAGDQFIKEIHKKEKFKHTPIMFYTATKFIADVSLMAVGCGVPLVLQKPCTPEMILEAIDTVFKLKDQQEQSTPETKLIILGSDKAALKEAVDRFLETSEKLSEERKQLSILLQIIMKNSEPTL